MGYEFRCEGCGWTYYTVGSKTWYTSGTVKRYPNAYCRPCAGRTGRNWSWTGNVVKLECCACSNLCGVLTWYDWKNRSGERSGYCGSCRSDWTNKKNEWETRESAANSCEWATVGWDGWSDYNSLCNAYFRIKCRAKYHDVYSGSSHSSIMDYLYKSECPRCVKEARPDFVPSSFRLKVPSCFEVDKKINNELWTKCIIYCEKYKVHEIYNGTNHQDIISALNASECSKCRAEQDALELEQQKLIDAENERKEAEKRAKEAEEAAEKQRIEAEQAERRRKAAERKRLEEEKKRKAAEKKRREEEEKAKEAEKKRKEEEKKREEAEKKRKEDEKKRKEAEKQQFDAAKAEAEKTALSFKNKADKIEQEIKNIGNFNADHDESKLNGIDDMNKLDESLIVDLEQQITDNINLINEQKSEIENVLNKCMGLSAEEKERATIESQEELDKILDELQNEQDVITNYKSTLREHNKKLDEKKKKVIAAKRDLDEKMLKEMDNKEKVDVVQQKIDDLLQNIQKIPGDQIKANPAAIKRIKQDQKELIKSLKEKNNKNSQLSKELNLCQRRLNKMLGKIAKSKSENIYLMRLLDEEYDRLNEAAESAEMKFEENGIYFLSITNGFDQNVVDLFVNAGYDRLDDIKSIDDEQDLIDIGFSDAKQRREVMRKLKIKKN